MSVTEKQMRAIVADLSSRDERIAAVIERSPLCRLGSHEPEETHFESLVESVISQQLSVKAAETIHGRIVGIVGGEVTPEAVMEADELALRSAGISGAKLKTIRGLADASISGRVDVNALHNIDDDDVIVSQLTSLWGIGTWTVDMFMMHQLARLDVWPTGDVGVRRGWQKIYEMDAPVDPRELHVAGGKFSPYRSVVAWYCWQAADE